MGIFSTIGTALGSAFGPIGSAVGGALGGAVDGGISGRAQRDDAKRQRSQLKKDSANKFVDMRAAAEKGGFHPLEALRSTGGAGYGNYGYVPSVMSSVMQGATTGAAEGYQTAKENEALKRETKQAMEAVNRDRMGLGKSRNSTGGDVSQARRAAAQSADEVLDRLGNPRTNTMAFGVLGDWQTNPNQSDAEYVEQRYGDIVEAIGGVLTLGSDVGHNAYAQSQRVRDWAKQRAMYWTDAGRQYAEQRRSVSDSYTDGDMKYEVWKMQNEQFSVLR